MLQYQAAGLPVVVNPVGAHREMVAEGETGFLATTASEWALAVHRLVSDARLRQQMGSLARRQVEANYSVSAWAETFVTSMTGPSRSRLARLHGRLIGPRPKNSEQAVVPHRARARDVRTFNQIGDR